MNYQNPNGVAVVLGNIREWYPLLAKQRLEKISEIKEQYTRGATATSFEFPSYALPKDEYLILDANHRLCALTLSAAPFDIRMFVVRGPWREAALADLGRIVLA